MLTWFKICDKNSVFFCDVCMFVLELVVKR